MCTYIVVVNKHNGTMAVEGKYEGPDDAWKNAESLALESGTMTVTVFKEYGNAKPVTRVERELVK